MKKILLVLLMISLGHSAFAMYCWEERSGKANHESRMTTKLGASNIVKVSSYLVAAGATYYQCSHSYEYYYYGNFCDDNNYDYCQKYTCTTSAINQEFKIYGANLADYTDETTITNSYVSGKSVSYPGVTTGRLYTYVYYIGSEAPYEKGFATNSASQRENLLNKYYTKHNYYLMHNPHYIHTFCTTVGGGGGGAAGAVVNYIIKAD